MPVKPTLHSRMSVGFWNSGKTLADMDPADTGAVFSVHGPSAFVGAQTFSGDLTLSGSGSDLSVGGAAWVGGTLTQIGAATFSAAVAGTSTASFNGAATFQSTVTVRGAATVDGAILGNSTASIAGQVTATGGLAVGGGNAIGVISTGTAAVSYGAINPLESSSVVTFAVSGLSRGDAIFITPDSLYPNVAANRDVSYFVSSSSTAGEAHTWAVNSTLTAVTPTASTFFRWVRVKGGNYPAA